MKLHGGQCLPQHFHPEASLLTPFLPVLTTWLSFSHALLLPSQAGLHPTAIELISVEQVTQRRTSPIRAVLRAVAALRQPSAQHAAAVEGADVAALTADPALQQLAAGGSPAVRLLSDAGSVDSSKRAVRAIKDGRRDLKNGRKLRQQVRCAVVGVAGLAGMQE